MGKEKVVGRVTKTEPRIPTELRRQKDFKRVWPIPRALGTTTGLAKGTETEIVRIMELLLWVLQLAQWRLGGR